MAHVSQRKKEIVARLDNLLKHYPVVGIADLNAVPASQLQQIREKLRDTMLIFMAKKSLLSIALKKAEAEKPGISKLTERFSGLPCLILSEETPFKLANKLAKNKTSAPAKAGQVAPNDILVAAGPTSFTPGPVISELGALGIKTKVESGKLVIQSDKIVAKEGEQIKPALASMLARLGIQPMEIGIRINAAYDNGIIFERDVLEVDADYYVDKLKAAGAEAFGFALELGYVVPENIELLIRKAHTEGLSLALEAGFPAVDTIKLLLGKANAQYEVIKQRIKL
jgi:large subunit ribosomal protein L10